MLTYPYCVRRLLAACLLALLAGCGGGDPQTHAISDPPPPLTDAAPVAVTVAGKVTFDYVPNIGGALRYDATQARPIRGATVEIVDAQSDEVLVSAQTDGAGHYQANLESEKRIYVRVKAELLEPGRWQSRILDNTQGDALYAIESSTAAAGAAAINLHAPSGWSSALSGYEIVRSAAPFAILDTIYRSQQTLLAVDEGARFPPLDVLWSRNNYPAAGELSEGRIVTSFYSKSEGVPRIYLLGAENVDTDEYDESVVAHEWGHYYEEAFSRSDSIGGPHSGEPLEMTVAFSEGWGDAWSAIALGRDDYGDSLGFRQSSGFVKQINSGPANPALAGWFSETSVAYIVRELHRRRGLAAIHAAMQSLRDARVFVGIHAWAHAVRLQDDAVADVLDGLLASQKIVASRQSNAFGDAESNSLDADFVQMVLPVYKLIPPSGMLRADLPTCTFGELGQPNKLLNHVLLQFNADEDAGYHVQITSTAGDPNLMGLVGGRRVSIDADAGPVDQILQLHAGPHVFSVSDYNVLTGAADFGCFGITIKKVIE